MKNYQRSYRAITTVLFSLFLLVGCNNSNPPTTTTSSPTSSSSPSNHGGGSDGKKININDALLSELDKLEAKLGIPALSNKIQAERPYSKPEELVSKKVITQAEFDKIKNIITTETIALTGEAKDIDYMIKMGLMKGHMIVAKELLDAKKPKEAEPHIGHPVEEIYTDIREQLPERKVKEFDKPLINLQDLIKAGAKDNSKIDTNFKESMSAIDSAIASIPETTRKSPKFILQVINGLLDAANSEYGAAIANGKIAQAIEYQDSRGFIVYADSLYQGIADQMTKEQADSHKIISENFKQLKTVWPSANPPAKPVKTPEDVTKLIKEIETNSSKVVGS